MEEKRQKLEDFHPQIEKETVFRLIHCYPDSPVYEDMEDSFQEMQEEMLRLCHPVGVMAKGRIPAALDPRKEGKEREAIFVLVTVGQEISDYSTRAFQKGDCVEGMLADAMADAALFSLEEEIQKALREACAAWHLGILKRLEAPQDIPMEVQREVLSQTGAGELLGMELSQGYMFRPLKTSCQIYLTTAEEGIFRAQHNCRSCPNLTCALRHIEPLKIRVIAEHPEEEKEILFQEGTVLQALCQQMEGIQAPCGGKGTCGKCRIQVLEGSLPIEKEDEQFFTEEELAAGWRLACQAIPQEDLVIRLGRQFENKIEVQARFYGDISEKQEFSGNGFGFAVDIGTTTVAIQLYDLEKGECLDTYTGLNGQRTYGADVIARIQAAVEGKEEELTEKIRQELWKGMERLRKIHEISWEKVKKIAIAGNTTMIHLLMGYPCEGLGRVPFTPYRLDTIQIPAGEIFPEAKEKTEILIYPGISTFVGADIVSGICALSMGEGKKLQMLIDLGTNGEMALGDEEALLVTSTAAGPAFEGGNITWGTGSIPGAICHAKVQGETLEIHTIQDQPPVGICGTGVIELVSELVKAEEIDETGRLEDPWFEDGYPIAKNDRGEQIVLTQKDVREIQLAKAAVRAGIETLLSEYGVEASKVDTVYVAGGFGYCLDYGKAADVGMFPEEFSGKLQAVGNSALQGAVQLLLGGVKIHEAERIASCAKEIDLSVHPVFQEAYMDAMFFE